MKIYQTVHQYTHIFLYWQTKNSERGNQLYYSFQIPMLMFLLNPLRKVVWFKLAVFYVKSINCRQCCQIFGLMSLLEMVNACLILNKQLIITATTITIIICQYGSFWCYDYFFPIRVMWVCCGVFNIVHCLFSQYKKNKRIYHWPTIIISALHIRAIHCRLSLFQPLQNECVCSYAAVCSVHYCMHITYGIACFMHWFILHVSLCTSWIASKIHTKHLFIGSSIRLQLTKFHTAPYATIVVLFISTFC